MRVTKLSTHRLLRSYIHASTHTHVHSFLAQATHAPTRLLPVRITYVTPAPPPLQAYWPTPATSTKDSNHILSTRNSIASGSAPLLDFYHFVRRLCHTTPPTSCIAQHLHTRSILEHSPSCHRQPCRRHPVLISPSGEAPISTNTSTHQSLLATAAPKPFRGPPSSCYFNTLRSTPTPRHLPTNN